MSPGSLGERGDNFKVILDYWGHLLYYCFSIGTWDSVSVLEHETLLLFQYWDIGLCYCLSMGLWDWLIQYWNEALLLFQYWDIGLSYILFQYRYMELYYSFRRIMRPWLFQYWNIEFCFRYCLVLEHWTLLLFRYWNIRLCYYFSIGTWDSITSDGWRQMEEKLPLRGKLRRRFWKREFVRGWNIGLVQIYNLREFFFKKKVVIKKYILWFSVGNSYSSSTRHHCPLSELPDYWCPTCAFAEPSYSFFV